jgi:hypothetical protein
MKKQITDREVLQQVSAILTSGKTYSEQYEALDCLWFAVENYHPSGVAAKVLEAVSEAQRHVTLKGGDPALSP